MKQVSFVFVLFSVFILSGLYAEAHVPNFVNPRIESEIITVEDPELSQAFYGELEHFPHTFEITSEEPFLLSAQILVPDIESSKNIISGIIIETPEKGGRVYEISRLHAEDGGWESHFEIFGGDSYRQGPEYESEVGAGTYRIEVNTPDNVGKYVLVLGKREEMAIGYFDLLGRIIDVKRFFEKTPLLIIQSVYVYVPLLLISLAAFVFRDRLLRKKSQRNNDIV